MSNQDKSTSKPWHAGKAGMQMATYCQSYAIVSNGGTNLIAGTFNDGIGGEDASKSNAELNQLRNK